MILLIFYFLILQSPKSQNINISSLDSIKALNSNLPFENRFSCKRSFLFFKLSSAIVSVELKIETEEV